MSWRDWNAWLGLHRRWVEVYGEEADFKTMPVESLRAIYEWLIREAESRDLDALHIDLLLAPSMTYADAKKVLKSALEKPLTVHELNELIQERMRQLKEGIEEIK